MCLLIINVQLVFIALMQKRLQKQITVTLNVRIKSGPHVPIKSYEESWQLRQIHRSQISNLSVLDISNAGQHFLMKN